MVQQLVWRRLQKCLCCVVWLRAPAPYFGGLGFKSRPGDEYTIRVFVGIPQSLHLMLGLPNYLHGAESLRNPNRSAIQEVINILQNPKVHYRVHKTRYWSLSEARLIQSTPSNPIYLKLILMLSPTYVQVFLVVSFLPAFPEKPNMHTSSPPCVLHALPIPPFISSF
jgi:hypothetical protein